MPTAKAPVDRSQAEAVAAAFWHRTRREFVPLTRAEVLHRCPVIQSDLWLTTRRICKLGWMKSQPVTSEVVMIYSLTPAGIDALSKQGPQA